MNAIISTLFGDTKNIAAVTLIIATAAALTALGHPTWAVVAMPVTTLAVIAWLVRH